MIEPRYNVSTWDYEAEKFTPQEGVPCCWLTRSELVATLRQLKGMGYECYRIGNTEAGHVSDPYVLVERANPVANEELSAVGGRLPVDFPAATPHRSAAHPNATAADLAERSTVSRACPACLKTHSANADCWHMVGRCLSCDHLTSARAIVGHCTLKDERVGLLFGCSSWMPRHPKRETVDLTALEESARRAKAAADALGAMNQSLGPLNQQLRSVNQAMRELAEAVKAAALEDRCVGPVVRWFRKVMDAASRVLRKRGES